jgi:hypothetical protein
VAVPLGLIAERWLLYYWPLVEPDLAAGKVVFPQIRGGEARHPIALRASLRDLIRACAPRGLPDFLDEYRSERLTPEIRALADTAINRIANTIVVGPVQYAGGALDRDGPLFGFEGPRSALGRCGTPEGAECALGRVLVPAGLWREMCLIGHWISESIVLRWADLCAEISDVRRAEVIEHLLLPFSAERDVQDARGIYLASPGLQCVWTDRVLRSGEMDVDHVIPFSVWHNNDLWNLLPSSKTVNSRKSDRLVARGLLLKRRDAIVHSWEILRAARHERFVLEVERSLGRVEAGNWQAPAFNGLVECVETLALQRGLERWEP